MSPLPPEEARRLAHVILAALSLGLIAWVLW